MNIKIYEAALVSVLGKDVLQKIGEAEYGAQGTTPRNEFGSSFGVVYFSGEIAEGLVRGWVGHGDFALLEKAAAKFAKAKQDYGISKERAA